MEHHPFVQYEIFRFRSCLTAGEHSIVFEYTRALGIAVVQNQRSLPTLVFASSVLLTLSAVVEVDGRDIHSRAVRAVDQGLLQSRHYRTIEKGRI